jgi:hypothetical protein
MFILQDSENPMSHVGRQFKSLAVDKQAKVSNAKPGFSRLPKGPSFTNQITRPPRQSKSSYKFLSEVLDFQIKQARLEKLRKQKPEPSGRIAHFLPSY